LSIFYVYVSLANLARPSLYTYILNGSYEVTSTYILKSNLCPLMSKGLVM